MKILFGFLLGLAGIAVLFGGNILGLVYCIEHAITLFNGTEPATNSAIFWLVFVFVTRELFSAIGAIICFAFAAACFAD